MEFVRGALFEDADEQAEVGGCAEALQQHVDMVRHDAKGTEKERTAGAFFGENADDGFREERRRKMGTAAAAADGDEIAVKAEVVSWGEAGDFAERRHGSPLCRVYLLTKKYHK
jgi:hypothetical protein